MGVSVVGHYSSLPEARVACSALHSAGFLAWVFDEYYGSAVWTGQVFLKGFRLVVPAVEGREAWEFLREIQPPPLDPMPRPGWTPVAMALALLFIFTLPLPWFVWWGLRTRSWNRPIAAFWAAGLAIGLAAILATIAVAFIIAVFAAGLRGPYG